MEKEVVKKTKKATTEKSITEKSSVLTVPMFDIKGKETGTVDLAESLFGHEENATLIAHYVRVYLQNQRQGTASTKNRSEIVGSTRKIYRQKGTGGARHGSRKSPTFVGGGVNGGPKPRDYSLDMNKKQKKKALFVSLSMKANEKAIKVLDAESLTIKPKTKTIAEFLNTTKIGNSKVLFVLSEVNGNGFVMSVRNIPNVEIMQAHTINPYAILNSKQIIFVGDALKTLEEHFVTINEN